MRSRRDRIAAPTPPRAVFRARRRGTDAAARTCAPRARCILRSGDSGDARARRHRLHMCARALRLARDMRRVALLAPRNAAPRARRRNHGYSSQEAFVSVLKPLKKAVLPVAGLGTRFLPATKAMAKEMLPVVDKPLIQYAIEEARAAGIEQFCFITGRGKTAIVEHFDVAYELERTLRGARQDRRAGRAARHGGGARLARDGAPAGADGPRPRDLVRPRLHRRRPLRHPAARRPDAVRDALP